MVKLRSRAIPSPNLLPGAEELSSGNDGDVGSGLDQQGPNDSLVVSDDVAAAAAVGVPGKRKPENRGLTASLRRAKTAMFRMATSPTTSTSSFSSPNTPGDAEGEIYDGTCDEMLPYREAEERMETECPARHRGFLAETTPTGESRRSCDATEKNVLEWMSDDAPSELLPRILSFCGSRQLNALSRANKGWNAVVKDDSIWRTLCEDTHKVRPSSRRDICTTE